MDLGMANAQFEVAGAAEGPASALLAHILGNACIRVALIDRMAPSVQHEDGFDGRTLAVALGPQQVGNLAGQVGPILGGAAGRQFLRVRRYCGFLLEF
jgi:hypothetical protein